MNLLYVEDDVKLAYDVKEKLALWFNVDLAFTAKQCLQKADNLEYDLIMVDRSLPRMCGLELCRQIRLSNLESLLVLTDQAVSVETLITAYEVGVDDFVPKPFKAERLLARFQKLVRRKKSREPQTTLRCGAYSLDQASRTFSYRRKHIFLNRKEYLILEFLFINKNQVVSRYQLFEHVWGLDYFDSNTIDVHIRRIRAKAEQASGSVLVQTIYGLGYCVTDLKRGRFSKLATAKSTSSLDTQAE